MSVIVASHFTREGGCSLYVARSEVAAAAANGPFPPCYRRPPMARRRRLLWPPAGKPIQKSRVNGGLKKVDPPPNIQAAQRYVKKCLTKLWLCSDVGRARKISVWMQFTQPPRRALSFDGFTPGVFYVHQYSTASFPPPVLRGLDRRRVGG